MEMQIYSCVRVWVYVPTSAHVGTIPVLRWGSGILAETAMFVWELEVTAWLLTPERRMMFSATYYFTAWLLDKQSDEREALDGK